jgi:hypothetical protein
MLQATTHKNWKLFLQEKKEKKEKKMLCVCFWGYIPRRVAKRQNTKAGCSPWQRKLARFTATYFNSTHAS